MTENPIQKLYEELLDIHGKQGWWPLLIQRDNGVWINRYHPGNYDLPKTEEQRLEIAIGSVLTQNTNWKNVVKALVNLKNAGIFDVKGLLDIAVWDLAEIIRPSGYYNQKAKKLQELAKLWIKLKGRIPERTELLDVWGIGNETADSILLYAFHKPEMVIDAYTNRVLISHGIIKAKQKYDELKKLCEDMLPRDHTILNEFHALLVKEGKGLNNSG